MAEEQISVDVVRASRDGHQFHEAWAARIALELLPPDSTLTALAIEGFSVEEPDELSSEAHEVADIVRYRGGRTSVAANRVETVQFKYSVAAAGRPMRASETAKTVRKFAAADRDMRVNAPGTPPKGHFELITNRPIDPDTLTALAALREADAVEGRVADHASQLREAIGLQNEELTSFAKRLSFTGSGGSLGEIEHSNLRTMASWAGATDNLSRARLSNLRTLVRDRAGSRGQGDNVIGRVDVLGALDLAHENDLFPVRAAFPPIDTPITRPILEDLVAAVFAAPKALLVHATGGVGKTVLMQAAASKLSADHCVLLFDGFGAGMWREPSDGRHLPRKALPHLGNLLAAEGLCDILLQSSFVEDSLSAFRARLIAAVAAVRAFLPGSSIVLVLDAIDHCGMQAERTHTQSFGHLLLQSLNVAPIDGVRVIASCRTHRRHYAQGEAQCREFEIPLFNRAETERLVTARYPAASQTDITALQRRSGGNPRLLDNLLRRGPPFDPSTVDTEAATLESLLREQIEAAQDRAIERGATPGEARGLLAGMALLPPPVPVDELAAALGLSPSDVDSFVADLFPLIESTGTGLIFRDEPTETLVVEMVGADAIARSELVARLQARQAHSIYAARALPSILIEVGEIDELVQLAFAPLHQADISRVARRAIRLARLNAAAIACASRGRVDDLTRIALDASRISSATERSDAYLRAHPDLVALSGDAEAVRRFRDDRRGWAGSRHAALAVLDVFSDDIHSAALESDRALTWFNWWIRERNEGRAHDRNDTESLEANAIFVQLLLGKLVRVDRFLAKLKDPFAFTLASAMLKLVSASERVLPDGNAARTTVDSLQTCRTKSPAIMAAISRRIDLPEDARRRLFSRLAGTPPTSPEPQHYWDHRRENALANAVIGAAGEATTLGLLREARGILRHAPAQLLRSSDVSDPWPLSGGIARHLKTAAILAAGRPRQTKLTDILPDDIRAVVPLAVQRRGPAAFERRLWKVLAQAKSERRKRDGMPRADDARKWEQLLTHRLVPLVRFVDLVSGILCAPDPAKAIEAALTAATEAITAAENYPYRDQARFLKQVLFDLVRWAASCHASLDRASGERLAETLEALAPPVVGEWLQTIELLARGSATHAAALRLARRTEAVVAADTSITEQIANYGALARALMPISADEARPYFRIGLELADAVGSDDQERIGDFIAFAAQYQGEPLSPETVHQFVRLCELNFPDEKEALDWRAFTRALAAIGGASAVAILSRLADREKVELGWTLPPMLKALLERQRLDVTLAAALVGLDQFKSTWNWFLPEMGAAILPVLPLPLREPVAEHLLVELDRTDATQIHSEELKGFKALFDAELRPESPSRVRIETLHADWLRRNPTTHQPPFDRSEAPPPGIGDAAEISAERLRTAIDETAAGYQGTRPTDGFILRGFVAGVVDPVPRAALLKTMVSDETLSFRDTVDALEEAQERWSGQSRALDEQIEAASIAVALRSLDDLVRSGDSWRRPLSRVARIAGNRGGELVLAVIAALAGQNLDISSDFWMSCAIVLAKSASAQAIGDALGRYAALTTEALPDAIGDGPWSVAYAVSGDADSVVAGLLWLRLGAPEAASRWRAAHALRRLLATGGDGILSLLMNNIDRVDAGAFQDRALPFFHLNARMWLLVAVARIAKDRPDKIAPFREALEAIATSDAFPHVVCRHFAVEALRPLADAGLVQHPDAYRSWLQTLNRPALPPAKHNAGRPDFYSRRPKGRPEPQPPFRFEYDFDKYQVDPLGRVFGLPKWDVEDAAIRWVRRYDSKIEHMWDCPRPRWSNEELPWGSASVPDVDLYGGQLASHAVLLAAGQFAKERPVRGDSWESTPWESWLEDKILSRRDGLWLADGTDLFPVEDRRPMVEFDDRGSDKVHVPRHPLDLLHLAGFDETLVTPTDFIVSGSWESSERLDITIGSQLVSAREARAAAHAVFSAEPFFAYLPVDQSEDDGFDRRKPREKELMTRWLSGDGHTYTKLDANDPYAFQSALQRVSPNAATTKKLGLSKADPFGRLWTDSNGEAVFRAEAWGTRKGRGRHRTERGGTRLIVNRDALIPMLTRDNQALLLLIKVRKYLEKAADDDSFRHQMLALIIRPNQQVEIVCSVPKALRSAIGKLGHYERGEFADRLAAVEAVGAPRRQSWPRRRARSAVIQSGSG